MLILSFVASELLEIPSRIARARRAVSLISPAWIGPLISKNHPYRNFF